MHSRNIRLCELDKLARGGEHPDLPVPHVRIEFRHPDPIQPDIACCMTIDLAFEFVASLMKAMLADETEPDVYRATLRLLASGMQYGRDPHNAANENDLLAASKAYAKAREMM